MPPNLRRGLWWIWGVGSFGWVAAHSGVAGWSWLRSVLGAPPLLLPDQTNPPGMPELPADVFLLALRDSLLPPLLVLLAGLLIGWIFRGLWKA